MIKAEIVGLTATIGGLRNFDTRVKARAFGAVVRGLQKARAASLKEITAGDHSLAVLAAMGHPYATRHPDPPHADPIIHQQTGAYVRAMRVTPPVGTPGEIIEGRIDMNGDPAMKQLDRWLQEGTMKMIARPWMKDVMNKVGAAIADAIIAELRAAVEESKAK
jgi:hypothetical protein